MKVIFAGTPEFAAQALSAILAAGHQVPLVLTQPDRPAGRGMQLQASAVKQVALTHQITVAQPISLRLNGKYPDQAEAAHRLLNDTEHDVMVVAAYGLILPTSVLTIPRLGCLNIHGSLLPRWRGAAPIQRAIAAGDVETGITIMQMDEGLDTGAMLLKESLAISDEDSSASLHDKLAAQGARLIVDALQSLETGSLAAQTQPETGVIYAEKIRKDESFLDLNLDAQTLHNQIRAFDPFPGCQLSYGQQTIKIWRSRCLPDYQHALTPGSLIEVSSKKIIMACGKGALELLELQKPGGKRLATPEFLQGFPMQAGMAWQSLTNSHK